MRTTRDHPSIPYLEKVFLTEMKVWSLFSVVRRYGAPIRHDVAERVTPVLDPGTGCIGFNYRIN
jgi:hypothetical protein